MQRNYDFNRFLGQPQYPLTADRRSLAKLSEDKVSTGFHIGSQRNGAWRIAVGGGGGDPSKTKFLIQFYDGSNWVTKEQTESE